MSQKLLKRAVQVKEQLSEFKLGVLKNFVNSTEKICVGVYFDKVAGLRSEEHLFYRRVLVAASVV